MSSSEQILNFLQNYSLYSTGLIVCLGLLGNCCHICLLATTKIFRSNPCAFYLMIGAIFDSWILCLSFVNQYSLLVFGEDPAKISLVWCKLRTILDQSARLLSTSTICFAAFDQFLSTNSQYFFRRLSTMTLARFLLLISSCLSLLETIPLAIYFQIDSIVGCNFFNVSLMRYYSYFSYPILHGILPIFFSCLFSLLAYRNVRRLVRRQMSNTRRRLDQQMTAMVFARVISFILLLSPYTIDQIYLLNIDRTNRTKNLFRYSIEQLVETFALSLLNINYGINMFLFLGSSARYRRQMKYFLVKKCCRAIRQVFPCRDNLVHPPPGTSIGSSSQFD